MAVKRLKPSQGPNSQQEVTSFVKECGILRRLNHRWAGEVQQTEVLSGVKACGFVRRMLCRH